MILKYQEFPEVFQDRLKYLFNVHHFRHVLHLDLLLLPWAPGLSTSIFGSSLFIYVLLTCLFFLHFIFLGTFYDWPIFLGAPSGCAKLLSQDELGMKNARSKCDGSWDFWQHIQTVLVDLQTSRSSLYIDICLGGFQPSLLASLSVSTTCLIMLGPSLFVKRGLNLFAYYIGIISKTTREHAQRTSIFVFG